MLSRRLLLGASVASALSGCAAAASSNDTSRSPPEAQPQTSGAGPLSPPADRPLRTAFLVGRNATNLGDLGPAWDVFTATVLGYDPSDADTMDMSDHRIAFDLYTVSDVAELAAFSGGLKVTPNYSVNDAPMPEILVIPSHTGNAATNAWMRTAAAQAQVVMSICTGAFNLAEAGLLDGVTVTTHRDSYNMFAHMAPQARLVRRSGFVYDGKIASTSSGFYGGRLALNVVKRYFGGDRASIVANYTEANDHSWDV